MRSEVQATHNERARLAAHLIAELRRRPAPVAGGRERFMLFAPPLVRAILDGRKTVTRRLATDTPQCPFGVAGDRLWVREKWGFHDEFFEPRARSSGRFVYAADGPPAGARREPWRPSLHMPRVACRVVLHITATRYECLNDLTPEEALKEGCPPSEQHDPVQWFGNLWNRLSGDGAWEKNPRVWVIDFEARAVQAVAP